MELCVRLDRVSKRHGTTTAVNQVSLEIQRGEFFSLLGPSGSGKTTLLRLIAGLDFPDQGHIYIQNTLVNAQPPDQRPVNLVFQHYALFPHLSVYDNVAFGLKMRRQSSKKIQSAVGKMLELVRLQGKERRFPNDLSGGEQQRVALARALVNEPVVVLLDEPLAALDQQLRQSMHGELKRLQQELHSTFICVTHQQDEALMLSDRLAVMSAGTVLQVGTPQELYHTPHSTTVADFIGLSNTVTGVIAGGEGESCWMRKEGLPPFKVPRPVHPISSERVTVMIRPEQLAIGCGSSTSVSENSIPGIVEKTVFNGNEIFCHVRLSTDVLWVVRMPSSTFRTQHLAIGQPVQVEWLIQDGIIFPVHGVS
ncbi:MAG: ABC transporter ATP-binding protein [Nitrospirales bacterium]